MSERLLGQEEIDALLSDKVLDETEEVDAGRASLKNEEIDTLGEIGNISMGSAATTLSQILARRVSITSPVVRILTRGALFESFVVPHLLIEVEYTKGLEGTTFLVIPVADAVILADLMMGNDGQSPPEGLTDITISAASEAMNQMIGTASTSMATMFRRTVQIGPPRSRVVTTVDLQQQAYVEDEQLVIIYFRLVVEGFIDSTIMQILDLDTARAEAALMLQDVASIKDDKLEAVEVQPASVPSRQEVAGPVPPAAAADPSPRVATGNAPNRVEQKRLDMLLDIPLKVSVILGRSRQPVKDVLSMTPGAVMGLDITVDEPVDILLNGTLVAKGEVVVVDENFGVRITSILSPIERLQNLRR
ncbi:MAG TPA: flagellar motor switch phosphatase FliY [Spirochaetia bacterium]|nr:flagellar motor switch phosphatase FliY [Spirochaetia bacterium]